LTNLQGDKYFAFNPQAIATWLGFACLPALLLSPLIASLAGSSRAWYTMLASSVVSIGVVAWANTVPAASSLSVFGILALASAFLIAAGIRLFWAALSQSGWKSTSVFVLFAFGLCFVLRFAFVIGHTLREVSMTRLGFFPSEAMIPAAVALASTIFSYSRPSEFVRFSEGMIRPFIRGFRDVFQHRLARNSLLGLWVWVFVAGMLFIVVIRVAEVGEPQAIQLTMSFGLGILAGIVLAAINRHAYRSGWAIPFAATGLFVQLAFFDFRNVSEGPFVGMGACLGLVFPPLVHYLFTWTMPKYHGVAIAIAMAGWCLAALAVAAIVFSLKGSDAAAQSGSINVLLVVVGIGSLAAWLGFFRPAMEGIVEILLWPVYRFRARGPGANRLPRRGPYLVIANHSAWFDPLFMAKVLPPPITPMMTSKFYDLPVLSWVMRRVIGTIRVPESPYRHEAPELVEAVAALDRGECVVLFPEGYLRRKEEQPLRRFGRGIWKILADRPQTPVFACWIEGNWGSYFSHRGGPPTKGKRMDFWKRIDIGIVGPLAIDPAMLDDHMAVRSFLMHQVSAARVSLGLESLELPAVPAEGEKE